MPRVPPAISALFAVLLVCCGMLSYYYGRLDEHHRVATDVVYGEAGGERLRLDVYAPDDNGTGRPAVILIHGGGWRSGSKADNATFANQLAEEGFVVFSIDYRLVQGTRNRYPAQVEDVRHAVRWVRSNAGRYGADGRRVGALGHSAGGLLAALLGTTDSTEDTDPDLNGLSSRVDCVVDTCGPADLAGKTDPPVFPSHLRVVKEWIGETLDDRPELYEDASPLRHVGPDSAPFLVFHGTRDDYVPLEQSRKLRDALTRAGVEATLITLEGEGHLFLTRESQRRWLSETVAFLRKHLPIKN